MTADGILAEQRRYYAARAPEYDDWWFRRGRYELDAAAHARWLADIAEVEDALAAFRPSGEVLELAAGTGLWTRHLAGPAAHVVAIDANVEPLELNRARVDAAAVDYVVADIFDWEPDRVFDLCFFGFWLSHVPETRFDEFWGKVRSALRPGGRVFLVDSAAGDSAQRSATKPSEHEVRRLSDGREFQIVKRFWEPEQLAHRVAELGFELEVRNSANGNFIYGGCS